MNTNNQTMALMFYNADCIATFKSWDNKRLMELVNEISELSLRVPIYETDFQKGYFNKITKDMKLKYLKVNSDNEFIIEGINKKYSPLFLMAVMEYGINKLSNNQIEDKSGFEHLKMAKLLAK